MLSVLRKKVDRNALTAVCPTGNAIAVARVRRSKGEPPVLELCEHHPTRNLALQGAEISKLTKTHHLDAQLCISILDLGMYNLLFVEAPDVPPSELKAAIRWRVKELIDFHIDDAVIDVFEVPDQKAGSNSMMYAVVAKSSVVKQQIDMLNGAGLNLNVIDIPEMAIRNIAAMTPEDTSGVAFLYLGEKSGLITITRQATLYLSRRIDMGIDTFRKIDPSDSKLITQRLDRIVVEIQRSLDYYESHFSQPPVSNIVLSPMSVPVPGITDYLNAQLGLAVRVLDLNSLIDTPDPREEDIQAKCLFAVGAALREEGTEL